MSKVLVGSVYGNSARNGEWYRLQREFLDAADDEYELAVFLNGVAPSEVPGATVIGAAPPSSADGSTQHHAGLAAVMEHFAARGGFDGYLLLDSDAFPIERGWRALLEARMAAGPQLPRRNVAAAVRTENLDVFPHPCVAYFTPEAMASAGAAPAAVWTREPWTNLLGQTIPDVSLARSLISDGGAQRLLPLLRTNACNPHPVLAAVYDGLFYHHGAGSREPIFRRTDFAMQDRYTHETNRRVEEPLFKALCADPRGYVRRLSDEGAALRFAAGQGGRV